MCLLLLLSRLVVSDSVQPCRWQPTRLPCPWDSPGKNSGMGCHFLLQCMKVKSESEVAQSCPTLRDPMDYSPPGSSVHGIFQARVLEWGAIAFSEKCVYVLLYISFFFSYKRWQCIHSFILFIFICICLFQWDETPRSRVTVSKGTHIYKVDRSCYSTTRNQSRHICTGNDDQTPVFRTETGVAH